jgi:hypothetical protein
MLFFRFWQGKRENGGGAVWSRSLTSFEMTGKLNVSFRAHREKSFSSLEDAIFELNHYRENNLQIHLLSVTIKNSEYGSQNLQYPQR